MRLSESDINNCYLFVYLSMSKLNRARTTNSNKEELNRFINRVVLITGGSSGIGQSSALRFSKEGAYVYLLDLLNGNQTLNKIKNENGYDAYKKCQYFKLNVTDYKQVSNVVNTIYNKHGYIDVLVQCAGITGKTGIKAHQIDCNDFEKVWRINVLGIFNVSKAVLPLMVKENYGRIINVASISGKEGNPGQASYASSKGAVIALTKTMV